MKKGLRRLVTARLLVPPETQTDLMKKGLRLAAENIFFELARNTDRPDEEGIKTLFCKRKNRFI